MKFVLLVFCIVISGVRCENYVATLDKNNIINVVSDKFISFSVDPRLLIETSDLNNGRECFCKGSSLSPAYIRIANPTTSKMLVENTQLELKDLSNNIQKVMDEENLQQFLNWIKLANLTPIFTLDNSDKLECGNWDPKTAVDALAMIDRANISDCVWEFGEKCIGQTWKEYASDINLLRSLLDAFTYGKEKNWKISSSDISSCLEKDKVNSMMAFIMESSKLLDAIVLNVDKNSSGLLDILNLEDRKEILMESSLQTTELWKILSVEENGHNEEALVWLKNVGNAAKDGYSVIFKNINFNDMNEPTLSYYVSLLHKKFVGSHVLNLNTSSESKRNLSVFAHCARLPNGPIPCGIALYAANEGEKLEKIIFNMTMNTQGEILQFILQKNNESKIIVNENQLTNENDLEADIRTVKPFKKMKVSLPAKSIGFWIVPNVDVDVCSNIVKSENQKIIDKNDVDSKIIKRSINENKISTNESENNENMEVILSKNEESLHDLITDLENELNINASKITEQNLLSILRRLDTIIELEKSLINYGENVLDDKKEHLNNYTFDSFNHSSEKRPFNETFKNLDASVNVKNRTRKVREVETAKTNVTKYEIPVANISISEKNLSINENKISTNESENNENMEVILSKNEESLHDLITDLENELNINASKITEQNLLSILRRLDTIIELEKSLINYGENVLDDKKEPLNNYTFDSFNHSSEKRPFNETFKNLDASINVKNRTRKVREVETAKTNVTKYEIPVANISISEKNLQDHQHFKGQIAGREEIKHLDLLSTGDGLEKIIRSNMQSLEDAVGLIPISENETNLGNEEVLVNDEQPRMNESDPFTKKIIDVNYNDSLKKKSELPRIRLINLDDIRRKLANSNIPPIKGGDEKSLVSSIHNESNFENLKSKLSKIKSLAMEGAEQKVVEIKIPFLRLRSTQNQTDNGKNAQKDKTEFSNSQLINVDKIKQKLLSSNVHFPEFKVENLAPSINNVSSSNSKVKFPKNEAMVGAEQKLVHVKVPFSKLKAHQSQEDLEQNIEKTKIHFSNLKLPTIQGQIKESKNLSMDDLVMKTKQILKNQIQNGENYDNLESSNFNPLLRDAEIKNIQRELRKHQLVLHGLQKKLDAKAAEIELMKKIKVADLKMKMNQRLHKREIPNINKKDELTIRAKRYILSSNENLKNSAIQKIVPRKSYQPLETNSKNEKETEKPSTNEIENLSHINCEELKWEDVRESLENIDEKSFGKIVDNVKDFFYKMKDKMKGWFGN